MFYYADEFNISWHPTLRAMWGPTEQQVMIPTPMPPTRRYGPGAVNWHSGETVVLTRHHKRRREVAELLEAILVKHPTQTVYVAWDNASTHEDDEVEAVLRGWPPRSAVPSDLQPMAEPDRDTLAPVPPRGHPLRAVRQHRRPGRGRPSFL